ncbi:MAG: HNH endonuclease [Anaerolineaceae bacterium]
MLTQASLRIKNAVDSGRIAVDLVTGSVSGARGKPLKPRLDRFGYQMVSFAGDYSYVHRIVAYAAFGEHALEPGMQIHHVNGLKEDNRAVNLSIDATPGNQRQAREGGPRPAGMLWKVVDPAAGKTVAHFISQALAEEYAFFKFGSRQAARLRQRLH